MNKALNILTFDIEDWYLSYHSSQIPVSQWPELEARTLRNTTKILEILKDSGVKATFFILGYEAEKNPELIRLIVLEGHEIGFHSCHHIPPEFQKPGDFENELHKGLGLLSQLAEQEIKFYRAPMFSLNSRSIYTLDILLKNGIKVSSSVVSGSRINKKGVPSHPFTWPNGLHEFPLPVVSKRLARLPYSGGGYFRALPFTFIQGIAHHRNYNMWYFHPRDFDEKVPTTPLLPWYRNCMTRFGAEKSVEKFKKLLKRFRFVSLGEAYNLWSNFSAFSQEEIFSVVSLKHDFENKKT